jgi:hypothetical protein
MRLQYEGVLIAPRRSAAHARSMCPIPAFAAESDFASYERIAPAQRVVSLVNYDEMYALLAQIVGAVRCNAGPALAEIVLNSRMPSTLRMPRELFGADIFLVHDVAAEARVLSAERRCFLAIHESFVRDYIETGCNELLMDWYWPPEDSATRIKAIASAFEILGIETRRIETVRGGDV